MNKLIVIAVGLTWGLGHALPVLADDFAAAKQKAEQVCAACHGPEGTKPATPDTPKLAGQHNDYLEHALREYQSGARQNALMNGLAKPLSKQEIKELAQYFSQRAGLGTRY
jgi:cytochrome c553